MRGNSHVAANAGLIKPFLELTPHEYDGFLDIILKGKFFMAQAAAKAMQLRGAGQSCLPLYRGVAENVELVRLQAGVSTAPELFDGGVEYLVLEGQMTDDDGAYGAGDWLRLPPGARQQLRGGHDGVLFYRKSGHLAVVIG